MKELNIRTIKSLLMVGSAAVAMGMAVSPTYAQDTAAASEKVTVTGTRIPKRDFTSDSPIATVNAESLKSFGTLTPETFLNSLPQIVPDATSTSNNPGRGGEATLDLRGLGCNRNLVLVNGRRPMVSGSDMCVDVNTIPAALLERVELITGGASAVYGADAIAGAVNFIMKKNFTGIQVDAGYLISDRGDAEEANGSAAIGADIEGGRGNVSVALSYTNRQPVLKAARTFTSQATATTSRPVGGIYRTSAANRPTQATIDAVFGVYGVGAGAVPTNGGALGFGLNPDGTLYGSGGGGGSGLCENNRRPGEFSTAFLPGLCTFNFEPLNMLVIPQERYSVFVQGNYDINPDINAYVQAMFTNYVAETQLAPSPFPTSANPLFPAAGLDLVVPVTNPFVVGTDLATLLAGRPALGDDAILPGVGPNEHFRMRSRFNSAPRNSSNEKFSYQLLAGLRGDFTDNVSWDIFYSYGRYHDLETQSGNINVLLLQTGLLAADGGASICAGGFNIFGNDPSADCLRALDVIAKNLTVQDDHIVEGTIAGDTTDLFELWAGPLGFAVGFQYQANSYRFVPDGALLPNNDPFNSSNTAGFNAQPALNGNTEHYDVFAEVRVPLIKDAFMAKEVNITAGYRVQDFFKSDNGGAIFDNNVVQSYKVEGEWLIDDPIRLRGSYQHAVRNPNVGELFTSPSESADQISNDPCLITSVARTTGPDRDVGLGGTGAVRAQCLAHGINAGAIDAIFVALPAQLNLYFVGGNPNVNAEVADTYTAGIVLRSPFESDWIKNLTVSIDYFKIELAGTITTPPAQLIVSRCYDRNFNPTLTLLDPNCARFVRDASGEIGRFDNVVDNIGAVEFDGIDMQLDWTLPLHAVGGGEDWGSFVLNFVGTYYLNYMQQFDPTSPLTDVNDTLGIGSIGGSQPEFKAAITTSYVGEDFSISLRSKYIDAMVNFDKKVNGNLAATDASSTWYLDLSSTVDITENFSIRAGVLNLLDQAPRLYTPDNQDGTDPETYDIIGRRYFMGATLRM